MIFEPIDHQSTARAVEAQIESRILQGVLRVGDRLPGERALADQLAVSRPIVRQALASLEERKLLTTRRGGGTFVADVIGTLFAPPVVDLISQDNRARSDFLDYRREMEAMTAGLAARRATDADRALLGRICDDMEAAHTLRDPAREAELDVELHSTITECAHNILLLHTMRACYRLLSDDVFFNRAQLYDDVDARETLMQQHLAIVAAIQARDEAQAAEAAARHIAFIIEKSVEIRQRAERLTIAEVRLAQRRQ
ncbi:MAG: FadR/GntR family transcriptional regulator [Pseudomonadota bacterium]